MLVNTVIYTVPPERGDEAEALLRELSAASRTEAGCLAFDVARGIDDPAVFVLHEVWVDQAALDEHFTTPHFLRYGRDGVRTIALNRTAYRGREI